MIADEEYTFASKLMDECNELINLGKTMDLRLVKVKDRFREVTKSDVQEFKTYVKELQKTFDVEGPSNSSFSLEEAFQLFVKFQEDMEKASTRQSELVNAEQLFNLDFYKVVGYPELTEVGAMMEKLAKIFSVYKDFVEFTEAQSSMLWADLDVSVLQQGIVDIEKQCRKLPKILKEIATYRNLEAAIVAFKESIPLIGSLKNDALKTRHWEKIMEATKIKFEMNPKTFTVGKLFAMKLNRFTDDINDLVNEAMQEAKIEAQLRLIEDIWRDTKFEYFRRKRATGEVYILRSASEITQVLEDNMLNLQTMSGSRFAVEYMEKIRGWEKSLNHVSETIEVWYTVQKKWMHLENIFIGAEDIRLQLPEEAKAFDAIDKTFVATGASVQRNPNVVEACHAVCFMPLGDGGRGRKRKMLVD